MIQRKYSWIFMIMLPVQLLWTGGCSHLIKPPVDQPMARALVARYAEFNFGLKQCKGLINIRLQAAADTMAGRLAWAGRLPDQLRVEWLTPFGQPLGRLIADGQVITLYSAQWPEGRRLEQTAQALEPLIHIPIGVSVLLDLLTGRLPLPQHAAARIVRDSGQIVEIELLDRWSVRVAFLQINSQQKRVEQLHVFAPDQTSHYHIRWQQWQNVHNRLLPRELTIDSGDGQHLVMTLDRYWCDVDLADETFKPDPFGNPP